MLRDGMCEQMCNTRERGNRRVLCWIIFVLENHESNVHESGRRYLWVITHQIDSKDEALEVVLF